MPTCISYTVCVETVRLLFGIPEPLNTYQNYTSQTLKTAHRILRRNGSTLERTQNYNGVQKLMFWQQCSEEQVQVHAEFTV